MRRTIATVSLSGTLPEKLKAIAAARFDGIELFEPDFIHYRGSARELRTMAADLGLTIDLYQPLRDVEGMPPALFRRTIERAERKFDLMQALDVPMLLVCSNTSPHTIDDPSLAAAQLHELAGRAAARNLRIGFEALAWGRATRLYGQAWKIVESADHPHLGLVLDSFHTLSLRDDPAGIATLPGHKVFYVQMADAPWLSMDVLQWARHHRSFPGQGQFDTENFFAQVLRSGYAGPLSLEIFNDVFRETPNRRIAVDAMRSLLLLESRVRKRLEREARESVEGELHREQKSAGAVLQRVELYDPPAVPSFDGFAYIEFAADETTAKQFGIVLEQLGFRLAGVHRSKAVTLYRQSAINVIVNAQPGSHARDRFDRHGLSVCALAVRTPDPDSAVGRAVAMQSKRYDSPLGLNEQNVPAIVSPGGILISFVPSSLGADGLFERDFTLTSHAHTNESSMTIDHVALALAANQLDTWVLFAKAVLDMEPGESLDLADPFGLVRSRGAANACRTMRFVLNVSMSERTRMAQAVRAGGGVTVHHVAFATDDLFASVERLRALGTVFIPISPNYYDDLIARLDLDAAFAERLGAQGVLFDRDDGGDYLHAYAEVAQGTLLIELVQRIGDYDGYGAANAPVRMASQAQRTA